jgi:hypothetical protein
VKKRREKGDAHTNSCDKLIAGSCIFAFTTPGACEEKGERRVTHTLIAVTGLSLAHAYLRSHCQVPVKNREREG